MGRTRTSLRACCPHHDPPPQSATVSTHLRIPSRRLRESLDFWSFPALGDAQGAVWCKSLFRLIFRNLCRYRSREAGEGDRICAARSAFLSLPRRGRVARRAQRGGSGGVAHPGSLRSPTLPRFALPYLHISGFRVADSEKALIFGHFLHSATRKGQFGVSRCFDSSLGICVDTVAR